MAAFQVVETDEERFGHRHPAFEIETNNCLGVIIDGVKR